MAVGSELGNSGEGIGGCGAACSDDGWIVMALSPVWAVSSGFSGKVCRVAASGSYCFQRWLLLGMQFLGRKRDARGFSGPWASSLWRTGTAI
jgi:hypothetical protein